MEKLPLPADFKDFLRLLNSAKVEYLLVGGYAVGHYGYPRTTGDMDIWIAATRINAERVDEVLRQFGFSSVSVKSAVFSTPNCSNGHPSYLHRRNHECNGPRIC